MLSPALVTLVALLLSPALAQGPPPGEPNIPPKVAPTKLDNFTWTNPFSSSQIGRFDAACEHTRTFPASEFELHDLSTSEPKGLDPYSTALKAVFGGRPYPGGWNGMDAHGYERNLLKMEYEDVPDKVKAWIEDQEKTDGAGKGLFAVFDKVKEGETAKGTVDMSGSGDQRSLDEERMVVFAPGAIYETLPLWVAEDSGCEDTLADLSKYSPKLVDGGVVGWPTDRSRPSRSKGLRKMDFTLKARVLKAQADVSEGKDAQDTVKTDGKDEL